MSGETILILSSSHLCRNPRVLKEATTLGDAGYAVTVLSVSVSDRFEQMDLELMRGRPFRRKVLDYRGTTLRSRLAGLIERGSTWAARRLRKSFDLESAQSLGPARALLRAARSRPAALTVAHTEIPLWAASRLMQRGRRVAVDFEDWYSEDLLPDDRRSRPLRLLRDAERYALNYSAYTSTTSESLADALAQAHGARRPVVLRNTFPLPSRSRLDQPAGSAPPRFIWFSQTIGPGRGLESFLSAWAKTRTPSQVHLLGDIRNEYREQLLSRLPESRRPDLAFLPLVTPAELEGTLAGYDLGLALEAREPRSRDLTITNKLFQYLNAGLAIVATDTAGQSEVLRTAPDTGLLIPAGDADGLTAQLDNLLADRSRLRACQIAARNAAITQFNWSHDAPRLLAAVEQALAAPIMRPPRSAPSAA